MTATRTRPSMTRRHFDAIAGAIYAMPGANIRERIARALAPALLQFNDAFDEERFVSVSTGNRRLRPARSRPSSITPPPQEIVLEEAPVSPTTLFESTPILAERVIPQGMYRGINLPLPGTAQVLQHYPLSSGYNPMAGRISYRFANDFDRRWLTDRELNHTNLRDGRMVIDARHVEANTQELNMIPEPPRDSFRAADAWERSNSYSVCWDSRNGNYRFFFGERERPLFSSEPQFILQDDGVLTMPIDRMEWWATQHNDTGDLVYVCDSTPVGEMGLIRRITVGSEPFTLISVRPPELTEELRRVGRLY